MVKFIDKCFFGISVLLNLLNGSNGTTKNSNKVEDSYQIELNLDSEESENLQGNQILFNSSQDEYDSLHGLNSRSQFIKLSDNVILYSKSDCFSGSISDIDDDILKEITLTSSADALSPNSIPNRNAKINSFFERFSSSSNSKRGTGGGAGKKANIPDNSRDTRKPKKKFSSEKPSNSKIVPSLQSKKSKNETKEEKMKRELAESKKREKEINSKRKDKPYVTVMVLDGANYFYPDNIMRDKFHHALDLNTPLPPGMSRSELKELAKNHNHKKRLEVFRDRNRLPDEYVRQLAQEYRRRGLLGCKSKPGTMGANLQRRGGPPLTRGRHVYNENNGFHMFFENGVFRTGFFLNRFQTIDLKLNDNIM